ncbi:MAG: hypothetical protein K2M60_06215, partial [Lachnospiraceae bacterium]|nr:hypothetical protein [Lachnospiraceae bacterium]
GRRYGEYRCFIKKSKVGTADGKNGMSGSKKKKGKRIAAKKRHKWKIIHFYFFVPFLKIPNLSV